MIPTPRTRGLRASVEREPGAGRCILTNARCRPRLALTAALAPDTSAGVGWMVCMPVVPRCRGSNDMASATALLSMLPIPLCMLHNPVKWKRAGRGRGWESRHQYTEWRMPAYGSWSRRKKQTTACRQVVRVAVEETDMDDLLDSREIRKVSRQGINTLVWNDWRLALHNDEGKLVNI